MKPTVLLDVDGILADFIGAALLALRAESGLAYSRDDIYTWEVFDSLPAAAQSYKHVVYELLKSKLGCFSMRVYDGAKEGVRRLQELADVVIVTSPFPDSDTWHSEREKWLRSHFGITREHVIHAQAKHHIKGDIFVDDKTANVVRWAEAHPAGQAMLWNMKYNENDELPDHVSRVMGCGQLHARVELWVSNAAVPADQVRAG
jgi:5'(3')-deoxyribonucleotidase